MREGVTDHSLSSIAVSGDEAFIRLALTDTAFPHVVVFFMRRSTSNTN